MDLATLAGMTHTWDAANTTSGPLTVINNGTTVSFSQRLLYGNGTADGWASVGVGYGWPPPAGLQDLSAYDGIQLKFLNTNNSNWFVNLYLNTGWTDPPSSEEDNFYEDGWIKIAPGVTTIVTLDFDAEGVINRNHVTNIGFQVGADLEVYPYADPKNPSNPDVFHIQVSAPEPVTLTLLGLGAFLLRRKR
jgi:hypothetical protein